MVPSGVEPKTSITTSDAQPLSYRRLVGAKAIKLRSRDKHTTTKTDVLVYAQWNKCDGIFFSLGPVFLKLINTNPGLKVNRGFQLAR